MPESVYERWAGRIVDFLLPEACPSCGAPSERGFCGACRRSFAVPASPCRRCGLPQPVARCPAADRGWALDAVVASLLYQAPVSDLLLGFKFGRRLSLGRAFGLLLAATAGDRPVDLLVPVPLHRTRLWSRGFNQADELARTVARRLGLEVLTDGVRRCRATAPQTGLSPTARLRNLEQSMQIGREIGGRRVALIDDVMTTGATLNALASACRSAGAAAVEAWVVARTIPEAGSASRRP